MREKLQYLLDAALHRNIKKIAKEPEDKKLLENLLALLQNGANVNLKDHLGCSPLFYANSKEVAAILIDNGADIE